VANAAPASSGPYSAIAVASASSKKLLTPIRLPKVFKKQPADQRYRKRLDSQLTNIVNKRSRSLR
jgi:hypothetical protein